MVDYSSLERYNNIRDNMIILFEEKDNYGPLNTELTELEKCHDERLREKEKEHDKRYDSLEKKFNSLEKKFNDIHQELNGYKKQSKDFLAQLDKEKENRIKSNKSIHDILTLRQALNILVWKYANYYTETISSFTLKDFNDMNQSITYKTLIEDSDDNTKLGMKYALLILNDKFNKGKHLSSQMCLLYFKINKLHHPKIKPKTIINNSIDNLKNIIYDDILPNYYSGLELTKTLLTEIQEECNNNIKN